MTILSVTDASRMAGVPRHTMIDQIERGELSRTPDGIEVAELIRIYPSLKPLANLKLREVKKTTDWHQSSEVASMVSRTVVDVALDESVDTIDRDASNNRAINDDARAISEDRANLVAKAQAAGQADTVQLLVRELEWNKELLEQTNKQMANQLAEQRAMIADQARRLDDKDRFWARQVEIAQSLLAAPAPQKRKKIFGIF